MIRAFVEMSSALSAEKADYLVVLGRGDLIADKRASGRPKDLTDLASLESDPS